MHSYSGLAQQLAEQVAARQAFNVLGIVGCQGSGKSTLAAMVAECLRKLSVATEVLSIDDLYLAKKSREKLASDVHPLLSTRGVPGTHDVPLGLEVIDQLRSGATVQLPRFSKADDERLPQTQWPVVNDVQVLIFEGWCLGAEAQKEEDLVAPVNVLEELEDADGRWRQFVNRWLGLEYQTLFACLDQLVFLRAPAYDAVHRWRSEQEANLPAEKRMSATALRRFVMHYERITRNMLAATPRRVTHLVQLDEDRTPSS